MKKTSLLYIPLGLLLALALSVLAVHYLKMADALKIAAVEIEIPFTMDGGIAAVKPEAEAAGFRIGDKIVSINGRKMDSNEAYYDELRKLRPDQAASFIVDRKTASGATESSEIVFAPSQRKTNFNYYTGLLVSAVFSYILPTFCILLGFWVIFVRPRDPLAWILLFVLLGVSTIPLENYPAQSLVGFYTKTFFKTWALAMLLFGIYFPERWSVDKKLPWLKWILIAPLSLQAILIIPEHFKTFLGLDALQYLNFITKPYEPIAAILNLVAISIFFAALGHKSGTLENPDARRRVKLILYGTSAAMLPSFLIILYRIASGTKGGFFDIVPFWLALFALLSMLLFPLTMAYVIVVHRAMAVSVVVRQGLQYALAKSGVRVLQIALSAGMVLTAFSFVSDAQTNRPQKMIFIALGVTGVLLIRLLAEKIRGWTDRRFFREAYDAEQILSDLSEEVRTMVETKPLLETVSNRISESLHVPQVALLLKNGSAFQPAYALGYESLPMVSFRETDVAIEKLKTNEPFVIYQDEKKSWENEEIQSDERENLRRLNSQLLLPVGAKDGLSGVISLSPKRSESPYTPTDLRLLKSVAAQTGLALENSRLTEAIVSETAQREQEKARYAIVEAENERRARELEGARQLQFSMLPKNLPQLPNLEIAAYMKPATEVGGDYYDFYVGDDETLTVAVGDATGHGLKAGTMVTAMKSLFGTLAPNEDIIDIFNEANRVLKGMKMRGLFMAMTLLKIKDNQATLSSAGMPSVLIYRSKTGSVEEISIKAMPLGSVAKFPYEQRKFALDKGDCLVVMSDGFPEMFNDQNEMLGFDKAAQILPQIASGSPQEIINRLVREGEEWADGRPQDDDVTFVVLKVKSGENEN